MGELDGVIMVFGGVLVILSLTDAFLTILHNDTDGPVIRFSFHALWKLLIGVTRIAPSTRRSLVPLAGPLMIVLAVMVWVGLFILGFSLIYWPNLNHFYLQDSLEATFMTALYFSGSTATVLGYGDISPVNPVLQFITFIQAGMGFALITGIITYLISVVSGVTERNSLALRLWAITGRTGSGAEAFIRLIPYENPDDIRRRLQNIHDLMFTVHQKMYQFPILDLYYRSRIPVYAPELMLRYAMHVSIAALIISADPKFKMFRVVAEDLADVTKDMMHQILDVHLGEEASKGLNREMPDQEDRLRLNQLRSKLESELPDLELEGVNGNEQLPRLFAQLHRFMDEMDDFTGWRMDNVLE